MSGQSGMRYRKLLVQNKQFRTLWLGQTVSFTGNSVYDIAMMWFVFERTGSAVQVALVLVASFLPEVVLGVFLGALADRFDRRRLMQVADAVQAAALGLLACSFALEAFQMWQMYVVTTCLSLASLLFSNAMSGVLPDVVDKEDLMTANSLFSLSRQVTRLAGSAVGGVVVAWMGSASAIGYDAFTFVVSLLFLQSLRWIPTSGAEKNLLGKKPSLWADVREGVRWLGGQRVLLLLVLIGTLSNIALGPTNVLPAVFIKSELQADASALGLFDAAIGIGLMVGGMVAGVLSPKRVGRWFVAGLGMEGLGMLVVSVAPNLAVACVGNFLLGAALMVAAIPMSTLMQVMTPSGMRGRVNSIMSLGFNLAIPITYGGIGALGELIGSRFSYVLGAVLLMACAVGGFLSRQVRQSSTRT